MAVIMRNFAALLTCLFLIDAAASAAVSSEELKAILDSQVKAIVDAKVEAIVDSKVEAIVDSKVEGIVGSQVEEVIDSRYLDSIAEAACVGGGFASDNFIYAVRRECSGPLSCKDVCEDGMLRIQDPDVAKRT